MGPRAHRIFWKFHETLGALKKGSQVFKPLLVGRPKRGHSFVVMDSFTTCLDNIDASDTEVDLEGISNQTYIIDDEEDESAVKSLSPRLAIQPETEEEMQATLAKHLTQLSEQEW